MFLSIVFSVSSNAFDIGAVCVRGATIRVVVSISRNFRGLGGVREKAG